MASRLAASTKALGLRSGLSHIAYATVAAMLEENRGADVVKQMQRHAQCSSNMQPTNQGVDDVASMSSAGPYNELVWPWSCGSAVVSVVCLVRKGKSMGAAPLLAWKTLSVIELSDVDGTTVHTPPGAWQHHGNIREHRLNVGTFQSCCWLVWFCVPLELVRAPHATRTDSIVLRTCEAKIVGMARFLQDSA